jgi:carbon starvation protein CstA
MFPLAFVSSTTLYAGWLSIFDNFLSAKSLAKNAFTGYLDAGLTATLMVCVIVILIASARAWMRAIRGEHVSMVPLPAGPDHRHIPGSGCC